MNWRAALDSYQSRCMAFFRIRLYFARFGNMFMYPKRQFWVHLFGRGNRFYHLYVFIRRW